MASPRLTEEEIHIACADIAAQGEQPTSLKLYELLGRGSMSTISKYLRTWKQTDEAKSLEADSLPRVVELPEELTKDSEDLLKKIWNVAKGLANREIEAQREALRQAEKDSQVRVEEAFAFSEAQEMKIERLEEDLRTLRKQFEDEHKAHKEIEHRLVESEKNSIRLEKDNERLDNELSATTTQVTEQQKQIKKLEGDHKAQRDICASELKAKDSEIKSLDQQLYKLQSHLDVVTDRCKTLTADYKSKESELSKRIVELEQLRGRHASTCEDLAETKKHLKAANKAATDTEKRIAKLEGQLETYQSLKKQED